MQRTYFLGGASPSGFETSFWQAHSGCYGYYLKGGPGTGKSTLMKKIAAAFSGEAVSCYHCASDPHSLDAVVLEERGIFIADATAPHESSTPLPFVTGETVDLAAGLHADLLQAHTAEITTLYRSNQTAHLQVRKGLAGITEMESIITDTAKRALDSEKLEKYAARFAKRILPKKSGKTGLLLHRQSSAVTPLGKMRFLPEQYDLILLHDPMRIAGAILLTQTAEAAVSAGITCEITHTLTHPCRYPVQLILPELRLIIAAVTEKNQPELPPPVSVLHMQRFYDAEKLRQQRNLLRFSARTAAATEETVIGLLAEALRIHDALETYYIRALDPAFLDQKTAAIIKAIAAK